MAILSNKKFLWGVIAFLIILNLFSLVVIRHTRVRKTMFNNQKNISMQEHFLHRKLNFTSEQKKTFDALITVHRQNMHEVMKEIGQLRKNVMESMNKNNATNIDSLINQIGSKQIRLEKINYSHYKQVLNICNPDQKEEFIQIMDRVMIPDKRFDGSMRQGRSIDGKRSR